MCQSDSEMTFFYEIDILSSIALGDFFFGYIGFNWNGNMKTMRKVILR